MKWAMIVFIVSMSVHAANEGFESFEGAYSAEGKSCGIRWVKTVGAEDAFANFSLHSRISLDQNCKEAYLYRPERDSTKNHGKIEKCDVDAQGRDFCVIKPNKSTKSYRLTTLEADFSRVLVSAEGEKSRIFYRHDTPRFKALENFGSDIVTMRNVRNRVYETNVTTLSNPDLMARKALTNFMNKRCDLSARRSTCTLLDSSVTAIYIETNRPVMERLLETAWVKWKETFFAPATFQMEDGRLVNLKH